MFGGRIQEGKDGEATFGAGIDHHIKAVAMIKAVSGRIPSDVAVRLGEMAVTSAVSNAIIRTVTDTAPAFPCGSDKGCAVTGDGKVGRTEVPEPVKKVIESANAGGIAKLKAAKDCIKRIEL